MTDWLSVLKVAKKSCIVDGKIKKVHYELGNGREMAEEWDMELGIVMKRAFRIKSDLRGDDNWDIELGDPVPTFNKDKQDQMLIREESSQPFMERRVTKRNLEWRIRNLSYPAETYSVVVNEDQKSIIVKTSNKKYYKIFKIPEFDRLNIVPKQDLISFEYNKFKTLIVTYKKPQELLDFEGALFEEIKTLKPEKFGDNMGCKPS